MEPLDAAEAVEAFMRYSRAFQSLDPGAPGKHFHFPSLMTSPNGVVVFNDESDVGLFYGRVMGELPGMGYARTAFPNLQGQRLSQDLAVVSGPGIWETASGKELRRFGLTYTLRRAGETWKILTALIYPPR